MISAILILPHPRLMVVVFVFVLHAMSDGSVVAMHPSHTAEDHHHGHHNYNDAWNDLTFLITHIHSRLNGTGR